MSSKIFDTLLFLAVLVSLSAPASSAVINSNDWRDTSAGINYLTEKGESYYIVQNPGEADIAERRHDDEAVYVSDNPGFAGLETSGDQLGLDWSTQYQYYSEVSGSVERFYVVPAKYGTEAAYALPKAANSDSFLILHDSRTDDFIKSQGKQAVYIGVEPSFNASYVETVGGNVLERNRQFLADHFSTETVYIAEPGKLSVNAMRNGFPILLKPPVGEAADFMESNELTAIAAESAMLGYVSRLQEAVPGETRAILSRGRVAGGEVVAESKVIEYGYRRPEPEISAAMYDPETGKLGLEISNSGNYPAEVKIGSVTAEQKVVVDRNVSVDARSSKIYPLEINQDSGNVSVEYTTESGVETGLVDVEKKDLSLPTKLSVKSVVYNSSSRRITATVVNTGNREAWVELDAGYSRSGSKALLSPGERKEFFLGVSGQEPKSLSIDMYQGYSPDRLQYVKTANKGFESLPLAAVALLLVTATLIVFYAGYIFYIEYLVEQ